MDLIEKEFRNKAIIRGNLMFFKFDEAISVVEKCRETQRRILGIDSFILTESSTQPVIEHSIDFSTIKGGNWLEAKTFIEDRILNDLVFEIVYE